MGWGKKKKAVCISFLGCLMGRGEKGGGGGGAAKKRRRTELVVVGLSHFYVSLWWCVEGKGEKKGGGETGKFLLIKQRFR